MNYHHLQYFYVTAKLGSIALAAEELHLTPQTISGQIGVFEKQLGNPLFHRKGRRLILNERGKLAFKYAEKIFALGNELAQAMHSNKSSALNTFSLGTTDAVPKVLAFDLVQPIVNKVEDVKLTYKEGDLNTLLADMAINQIDLILSDRPLPSNVNVKAFNHYLGHSGVSFFAPESIKKGLVGDFPQCLDGQPLLISSDHSTIKSRILAWFEKLNIEPTIVAEFDDSALLKLFGQEGHGIFCSPTSIEAHVSEQYQVSVVGRTKDITEQYYLISTERTLKNEIAKELLKEGSKLVKTD